MQGRIFLHVGPPKTATTALQYALQGGISGKLEYGGVSQPRDNRKEVSSVLHDYCMGRINVTSKEIGEAIGLVRSVVDSGRDLFISEEMFLVDSASITYKKKIEKLAGVLKDFNLIVILCLRNPVEAIPSLYQELYKELPLFQKISFRLFTKGNQASIYNYIDLIIFLNNCGFSNVKLIRFDRLVSSNVRLSEIFGEEYNTSEYIVLEKVNVGIVSSSNGTRQIGQLSIQDIINIGMVKKFLPSDIKKHHVFKLIYEKISKFKLIGKVNKKLVFDEKTKCLFEENYKKILYKSLI